MISAGNITRLRPFGPKSAYLNVIIEAPKGSRTKFKYDEEHQLFLFDKTLPLGQAFPFDFGFVPSTTGGDGDPLDILIMSPEPTFVGCLVHAKLLGVIEAEQTEKGKTERNDRLIGVPLEAKSGKPTEGTIDRLDAALAQRITDFFVAYNQLQGKRFKALRSAGPDRAASLIKTGIAQFRTRSRKRPGTSRRKR
jgi:inorganic pyrophosphatase